MAINDNDQRPTSVDSNSLIDHLNRGIEREMHKLRTVMAELQRVSTVSVLPPYNGDNREECRQIIRQHEKYRLAAQLEAMEKSSTVALVTDEKLIFKLTQESFHDEVSSSSEVLDSLLEELKKEVAKGKSLDATLDEERRVLKMVQEQCCKEGIDYPRSSATSEPGPSNDQCDDGLSFSGTARGAESRSIEDQEMALLEDEYRKLKKLNRVRTEQLGGFLTEHFPVPNLFDNEADSSSEDLFSVSASRQQMRSLASLVQDLVNAYLDPASNNYIEIDSCMWGPHIEFLLRCGVAVRNPNNASLLRLEKFAD